MAKIKLKRTKIFIDKPNIYKPKKEAIRLTGRAMAGTIRLETLRNMKHVVGVAGGKEKIYAIAAAIRGGIIHSLITDEMTAQYLLSESIRRK